MNHGFSFPPHPQSPPLGPSLYEVECVVISPKVYEAVFSKVNYISLLVGLIMGRGLIAETM